MSSSEFSPLLSKKEKISNKIRCLIFFKVKTNRVRWYFKGDLVGIHWHIGFLYSNPLCMNRLLQVLLYQNCLFLGLDKLITLLVTDWLADIRQNQIPAILGGVGPMHSFLQLAQGIKDLFIMPVEQYQKDGRLMRGFQKGTFKGFLTLF